MSKIDYIYDQYKEIDGLKSRRGEFTDNDHLFATMALMYSISSYCKKYRYLDGHYYDLIDLYYDYKKREDIKDVEKVEAVENIRIQQDYAYHNSDTYEDFRERMIKHIMNFDNSIDFDTANKIFNMYFSIYLGGLLNIGDEKISDRAISNLMLYDTTSKIYNYGFNNSDYSNHAMFNYFKMANKRFTKLRINKDKASRYGDELSTYIVEHRKQTNNTDYFSEFDDINYSQLEGLYRIHNLMDLNLHKKFRGKRIKQTDLFANSDYRIFKNIYPEVKSIIYGDQTRKEEINEYLMDFVDRLMPYHNIDGAYTVRYTDTDYKLVIVTKSIEDYNQLLEGLINLVSSINRYNNKVSDVSFTIMPVFAHVYKNPDFTCDSYKESLLDSDTILYDKKRFLRKTKGKLKEEFKNRNLARQYVKRDK